MNYSASFTNVYAATVPKLSGVIEYQRQIVGSTGTTGAARAAGTAYRGGMGSVKGNGNALGGELGPELVVRDGRFFTIGDDGAEFFEYRDGDIIFNASQTKELLSKGKIKLGGGRGMVIGDDSAYAEGTAFALNRSLLLTDTGTGKTKMRSGISGTGTTGTGPQFGQSKSKTSNKSKTSGNKSGKSKTKAKDSGEDLVDWIEIAIARVERVITNLSKTASSAFKTLAVRLSASNDQIATIYQEIETQQKGYERYLKQADSVKLSDALKQRVRDGAIDINNYDEETRKLISDYQQWYEKALACSDAVQDLHEDLGKLYQDRFSNIEKDFDNQLSMLEHLTNTYDNALSHIEEKGYMGGQELYRQMMAIEQQNITVKENELKGLVKALSDAVNSGEIEEYSEAWYDMRKTINDVTESIQESETAVVKYGNSIRQINWDAFDYVQERISAITEEADFLIGLMESSQLYDDRGQLTGTGNAQMGLHAINYDVYMEQADEYADEVKKINADLAKDPGDTELIKRREELLKLQRDSISAAEQEKQAVADMVEEGINRELESLRDLIDTYKEGLDSAKDLYEYQKRVSEQTKQIATLQKQMSAYSNDTSEENRARVQKITVDLQKAQQDLQETQYNQSIQDQKALLDNLYDEYEMHLNERLDNIDALMNEMIDYSNLHAEEIRATIATEGAAVGYAVNTELATVLSAGGPLGVIATKYGDGIITGFNNINANLTPVKTATEKIKEDVARLIEIGNKMANTSVKAATEKSAVPSNTTVVVPATKAVTATPVIVNSDSSKSKSSGGSSKSGGSGGSGGSNQANKTPALTANDAKKIADNTVNALSVIKAVATATNGIAKAVTTSLKTSSGSTKSSSGKATGWVASVAKTVKSVASSVNKTAKSATSATKSSGLASTLKKVFGFSKGGYVADMQKVAYKNGDDIVTLNTLKRGEAVFTEAQYAQISKLIDNIPKIQGAVDSVALLKPLYGLGRLGTNTTNINVGGVNIPIDHVENYDDLVRQMRDDKEFERFIGSISVDKLSGKSSLGKKRYYA